MSNDKNYKRLILSSILLSVLTVCSIGMSTYLYLKKPKLGFVYNNRILNEYNGVKEGKKLYAEKAEMMTANLDTLGKEIDQMIGKYQQEVSKLSTKEKELTEQIIKRRQSEYFNYKKVIEEKTQEEDKKITEAVLKQIDSFIAEYAKNKGYDYIFGSSDAGSLFFASEKEDLTDEILKGLNGTYEGK